MSYSSQIERFGGFGEGSGGCCRLYLDMGRTEPLSSMADMQLLEKAKSYFMSLSKALEVVKDETTKKQFCSIYLYHPHLHNPECPAYQKHDAVESAVTVSDFNWPKKKEDNSSQGLLKHVQKNTRNKPF